MGTPVYDYAAVVEAIEPPHLRDFMVFKDECPEIGSVHHTIISDPGDREPGAFQPTEEAEILEVHELEEGTYPSCLEEVETDLISSERFQDIKESVQRRSQRPGEMSSSKEDFEEFWGDKLDRVKESHSYEEPLPTPSRLEKMATASIKQEVRSATYEEVEKLITGLVMAWGFKSIKYMDQEEHVDIFASRQDSGSTPATLKVAIIESKGQLDQVFVRSFLSRIGEDEAGLLVSTADLSDEDHKMLYNQTCSKSDVRWFGLEGFVEVLLAYYDEMKNSYRSYLPLKPIYIPYPDVF
jgi:predicted Mrr-cat superfamily restriction endonuclease